MATIPLQTGRSPGPSSTQFARAWSSLADLAEGLSKGFSIAREHEQRGVQISALSALSDAQLAAKGLTRDRIVHHVYADLLAL